MFTPEEKMQLFNRLPALELSYEPKLHKKVYSPMYYIIPKGPKALVWYTYWLDQHVCLLIMLNERGNYSDIKLFPACFSDALALGTIIYGTHFIDKHRAYFTCEQLYYYKGMPVKSKNKLEQLPILLDMFQKEVEQVAYTTNSLIVGLPVMTNNYEEALALIEELPYKVYGIGGSGPLQPPFAENKRMQPNASVKVNYINDSQNTFKSPHNASAKGGIPLQPPFAENKRMQTNEYVKVNYTSGSQNTFKSPHNASAKGGVGAIPHTNASAKGGVGLQSGYTCPQGVVGVKPLCVRAGLSADTYMLYNPSDNTLVGTAMIPTYKSSVFLNGLFRNIKENANLDLLEESDDEDEFENTELDKFVNLDKTILMECVFLKRFQKWQPVKVIKMC